MKKKKLLIAGVVLLGGVLICAPTNTYADTQQSEAVVDVSEAATSGGIVFLETDKMSMAFENLVVDETTANAIQTNGLKEKNNAVLKIEDNRKNVKPGEEGYSVQAFIVDGSYGDKSFLKNKMTVVLKPEATAIPLGTGAVVVYKGQYDKVNKIKEVPLQATLKIQDVLSLTEGKYGGQITWVASPDV